MEKFNSKNTDKDLLDLISLEKGESFDLSKNQPGIQEVRLGLGWDINPNPGDQPFDLDVSVFALGSNGHLLNKNYFVFYNNLQTPDGAVVHMGDNRTGEGQGDDEQIDIKLEALHPGVQELVFIVTIYDFEKRKQTFGRLSNAYIRLTNQKTGKELLRYTLNQQFTQETALTIGGLYKDQDGHWQFTAIGKAEKLGLGDLVKRYQ